MKNLITLMCIAFVAVVTPVFGEVTYEANPTNYLQVSEAIYEDGLPLVAVDLSDIEDHLDDVVNTYLFNPTMKVPSLTLAQFDDTNIKLTWTQEPGVDHYEVFYLNLNDGSSGIRTTSGSEVNIGNPSAGVYTFSIIAVSWYDVALEIFQQSFANIIIKQDIMQFTTPSGACNYQIDSSIPTVSFEVGSNADVFKKSMSSMIVTERPFQTFKLTLEMGGAGNPIDIRHLYFSKTPNGFEANCWDGLLLEEIYEASGSTGTLFTLDEWNGGTFPVSWLNTDLVWYLANFDSGVYQLSKAFIQECLIEIRSNNVSENTAEAPLRLFPNPTTDLVQIKSRSNKTGLITITNQLGQVVFTKDLAYSDEEVDVKDWPEGVYFVNVKIKNENFQETFVKVAQ